MGRSLELRLVLVKDEYLEKLSLPDGTAQGTGPHVSPKAAM